MPPEDNAAELIIDALSAFCSNLTLDSGVNMTLEPFMRELVRPWASGVVETGITIGKANAKSTLLAAVNLFHLLYPEKPGNHIEAKALVVATARDQARLIFDQMEGFVERSLDDNGEQWLKELVTVQPGYLRILKRDGRGEVKCAPADARTVDGQGNTLVSYDEFEHAPTGNLYGKLRDGLPKRGGSLISISTAGEAESPWGRLRARALKLPNAKREGCKFTAQTEDGTFAYIEYSLSDDDAERYEDFELVKQANPLSIHTPQTLEKRYHSPSMEPWQWARDCCGLVFGGENSSFDALAWRRCGGGNGLVAGEKCAVGIDLAARFDTSAFIPFVYDPKEDLQIVGRPTIIHAPSDGSSTSYATQLEAILQINERNPIDRCVVDPNAGWQYLWEMACDHDRWPLNLRKKYSSVNLSRIQVVPYSQQPSPMSTASMGLAEAIRAEKIVHPDDGDLSAHILACKVQMTSGNNWRIVKQSVAEGASKIDAAVALAIVRQAVMTVPKRRLEADEFCLIAA